MQLVYMYIQLHTYLNIGWEAIHTTTNRGQKTIHGISSYLQTISSGIDSTPNKIKHVQHRYTQLLLAAKYIHTSYCTQMISVQYVFMCAINKHHYSIHHIATYVCMSNRYGSHTVNYNKYWYSYVCIYFSAQICIFNYHVHAVL